MEEGEYENGIIGGGSAVKVMTDEQMEMLRKQISVYVTLCENLAQFYNSFCAQHDFNGMRFPNQCGGQFFSYSMHKSRQRWAPKPAQLEILESIFEQSNATPDRQRLREITAQLAIHGPISENNVYNWFQNRRARSKRKQLPSQQNNGESEAEPEAESAKDKKTKSDDTPMDENLALMVKHMYFQSPEIGGIDQLIGKTEVPLSYNPYWQMDHHDKFS